MKERSALIINCGSSSIKFAVINPTSTLSSITGLAERLGDPKARLTMKYSGKEEVIPIAQADHKTGVLEIIHQLQRLNFISQVVGIGHRVVHGGEYFSESILIDGKSLSQLASVAHLAPLHNPLNLEGIQATLKELPKLPQVAVFDTAFHQTIPQEAFLYALPFDFYKKHNVRRYGFHGTSYRYVSQKAATLLKKEPQNCCFLVAHLGNGCSATAIAEGKSVDTSMGLTPLEGLIMGTRSGDVDPGLHHYLATHLNMSLDEIMNILNKKSGLLGLSGISNDMRTLEEEMRQGNTRAALTIEVFCFRVARYLGALAVSLPRIDALIFTGGIGENGAAIRENILSRLSILGFQIDAKLNQAQGDAIGRITQEQSTLAMCIPTNEELMIAQDALTFC